MANKFSQRNIGLDDAQCFLSALEILSREETSDANGNLKLYDFIIQKLKIDIAAEAQLDYIVRPKLSDKTMRYLYFPDYVHSSNPPFSIATNKYVEIELSSDTVVVSVDKTNSLIKPIFIKHEDTFNHTNLPSAIYYPYLDLCIVTKGISFIFNKKKQGKLTAQIYDFPKMFQSIYTDGKLWYAKNRKPPLGLVRDYRYALLFEFAKKKYFLENHTTE